ncbi:hypothetical protein ACHMW6_15870 [Pseudoduganella sp. UC29_106]|uniref:hypothetical protein n=1 Tax=Pseudoduganella sp. UC29_106 TaxID=3374553 RepID=UPI00375791FB
MSEPVRLSLALCSTLSGEVKLASKWLLPPLTDAAAVPPSAESENGCRRRSVRFSFISTVPGRGNCAVAAKLSVQASVANAKREAFMMVSRSG